MNRNEQPTRQSLLLNLRNSSNEMAWESFYDYYHNYIGSLVRHEGICDTDKDDLMQTICLKCWKALREGQYKKDSGKFRNWLGTICRNAARDHLRQQNARLHKQKYFSAETDKTPAIDEIWIEKEWQKHMLALAWEEARHHFSDKVLSAYQRIVLGEKAEDIAQSMQLAVNTIHVYRNRVEDALATYVRQFDHYL